MFPTGPDWVGRVERRGVLAWLGLLGVAGVQIWPRDQGRGPVAASVRPSGARVGIESHLGLLLGGQKVPLPLNPRKWSKRFCKLLFSRVAGKMHLHIKPKRIDLRKPLGLAKPVVLTPRKVVSPCPGSDLRTHGVAWSEERKLGNSLAWV